MKSGCHVRQFKNAVDAESPENAAFGSLAAGVSEMVNSRHNRILLGQVTELGNVQRVVHKSRSSSIQSSGGAMIQKSILALVFLMLTAPAFFWLFRWR